MKTKLQIELANLAIRYAQTVRTRKRLEADEAAIEQRIGELQAALAALESAHPVGAHPVGEPAPEE